MKIQFVYFLHINFPDKSSTYQFLYVIIMKIFNLINIINCVAKVIYHVAVKFDTRLGHSSKFFCPKSFGYKSWSVKLQNGIVFWRHLQCWRNWYACRLILLYLSLLYAYEADADASEVSMYRAINFVVKQMQMQAVHTWCRSKRLKHLQKDIEREKQTVGWIRKDKMIL